MDNPSLPGIDSHLSPVSDVEFAQDVADMPLDGVFADDQLFSDLAVGQTAGNQFKQIQLAPSQFREKRLGIRILAAYVLQHTYGDTRVKGYLALDGAVQAHVVLPSINGSSKHF
jgi:hypothetical protein